MATAAQNLQSLVAQTLRDPATYKAAPVKRRPDAFAAALPETAFVQVQPAQQPGGLPAWAIALGVLVVGAVLLGGKR